MYSVGMSRESTHPIGGVDYPLTMQEFDEWFPTEEACAEYLMHVRWPTGFVCPSCGGRQGWRTARRQIRCRSCQRQTSVVAGTILQGTRKPLRTWLQAAWYITSQKIGGNALGLKRVMGFGSYQTAWTWLHKMRRAMVRPDRDGLSGRVEFDETYIGGKEEGVNGRQTYKKAIVAVALEVREPKGFDRVRLRRVPDVSKPSLAGFICDVVAPGATILTDGFSGYDSVPSDKYSRQKIILLSSADPAHFSLPSVHRVASLLKRWLLGTHQGAVSDKHLD
jgi:transposase-like protein